MTTQVKTVLFVVAVLLVTATLLFVLLWPGPEGPPVLAPQPQPSGGTVSVSSFTFVGTGSSRLSDPTFATREALSQAATGGASKPKLAVIFASNFASFNGIYAEARRTFGPDTRIFGGASSTRAVMTQRGLLSVGATGTSPAGLVAMTINSSEIDFGVGSAAQLPHETARETTRRAVDAAIRNSGRYDRRPSAVVVLACPNEGEAVAAGLDDVLDKAVPVVGGCVAGPSNSVIGNDVLTCGVAVMVLYTDLPIGWTFEGGFDVTDARGGQVTGISDAGRTIDTIDGRPATDVYNEWTEGEVARLFASHTQGEAIDSLTLYPCYRKFRSPDGHVYMIFTHTWPDDPSLVRRSLRLGSSVERGDRLYLARGSWETLLNRIGNLPIKAKVQAGMDAGNRTIFGLGFICSGVFGAIPQAERPKIPVLLDYAHGGAPFLGMVTGGELGSLPGIGNKYGNLLTSFLTIGPRPRQSQNPAEKPPEGANGSANERARQPS